MMSGGGIVVQLYNIFHNLHDRGVVVLHCAEMDVIKRRYSGALITHGNWENLATGLLTEENSFMQMRAEIRMALADNFVLK